MPMLTPTPLVANELPPELRQQLQDHLQTQTVLDWAELDLNDRNEFAKSFVVLTQRQLLLINGQVVPTEIDAITDAKVVEGVGMDRLQIRTGNGTPTQLRYSRKFRKDVVRLNRKLGRMLPDPEGKREARPEWLDRVERQAEASFICGTCKKPIPSYANGVCPNCTQSRTVLWRLMDVAKPYRKQLLLALGLTLLHAGFATAPGWVQMYMINDAIAPKAAIDSAARVHSLLFWASIFVAVILLSEVIGGFRMAILSIVGTKVTRDLRHDVYAHLNMLSMRFFAKRRSGSLITRVTNDTDRLWDFIVFGSVNFIRDALMVTLAVIIMLSTNWRLALICLVPLPVIAVVAWMRSKKMHAMFGHMWTYWSRISAVVGDAMGGVRVVKAFAGEQREIARFDARNRQFTEKEQEVNRVWWQLQPMVSGVMRISSLLVWVVGGYFVIRDWHIPHSPNDAGTLFAFAFYVQMFFGPIGSLSDSARMVTRAASSAQRVFEVLDTPPEIFSKTEALKLPDVAGKIEFRNVGFSYEGAQPALRDVSLTAEPGQMIGLCGHSGAGKSTIVNLLCRFYDVTDGQILLDGRDVRDYDVQWLRTQIGVVLQEPYLFHGTIADNIRYGRPDATDREIIEAARAANAHDFIVGFPDGYDTTVGERGQSLSGGERQRVSIARAILHNPKVLVLDEATSSLDTETERQIQEAMNRLVIGRTTIAIAHRLSTLQTADKLVVLEKGRVAEEGTHAELAEKENGVYAKLYRTQMEMNQQIAIK